MRVELVGSQLKIITARGAEGEFHCREAFTPDKEYRNAFYTKADGAVAYWLASRKDFEYGNDAFNTYLEKYKQRVNNAIQIYNKEETDVAPYEWLEMKQRVDIEFMQLPGNKMNGNEAGAGKTRELIGLIAEERPANTLVICLKGGKYWWQEEIASRTDIPVLMADGLYQRRLDTLREYLSLKSSSKALVINYDMLTDGNFLDLLKKVKWDYCFVDEAHMLCGRKTDRIKGFKMLRYRFKKTVYATATSMPKRAYQIWQILNLMDSSRFSSYWRFIDLFFEVELTTYSRNIGGVRKECLEAFHFMLSEFMTNRPKREIHPNIPEKEIIPIRHKMSDYQQYIQDSLLDRMEVDLLNGNELACPNDLVISLRLRQMLLDPSLIGGRVEEDNPKNSIILDLIETHLEQDEKIVVFAWFNDYVEFIAKLIQKRFKTKPALVYRETSAKDILVIQKQFAADPKLKIICASIGTGGTGTNFQAARIGIMADKSSVPKDNQQAFERLDRPGQLETVLFYDLVCEGSYEEAIDGLLQGRIDEITEAQALDRLRKIICKNA
jgi:SNF2 family DNA or RNA helicase